MLNPEKAAAIRERAMKIPIAETLQMHDFLLDYGV